MMTTGLTSSKYCERKSKTACAKCTSKMVEIVNKYTKRSEALFCPTCGNSRAL